MDRLTEHRRKLEAMRGQTPSAATPTVATQLQQRYATAKTRDVNYKGVGDLVWEALHKWKIPHCQLCEQLRRDMNFLGPEGCRENLQTLAEAMHRNAQRNPSGWVRFAEWADHAVEGLKRHKQLVLDACKRHEDLYGNA